MSAAPLTPEAVVPLLRGRYGRPYTWRESCSSTQLLLAAGDPDGAVAVAEEQTAGRGRLGRVWETPPGRAILVSVLLRPPAGRPAPQLSIVAGIAVARTVEAAAPARAPGAGAGAPLAPRIKWPNDVLLDGRKCCGILAEARDGAVILGIGLNVNQLEADLPPTQRIPPTSLRLAAGGGGAGFERAPLLAELLWQLEVAVDAWAAGGLAALHGELAARDFLAGRLIMLDGAPARVEGIDASGALVVDVGGARRLVDSGEILLAD